MQTEFTLGVLVGIAIGLLFSWARVASLNRKVAGLARLDERERAPVVREIPDGTGIQAVAFGLDERRSGACCAALALSSLLPPNAVDVGGRAGRRNARGVGYYGLGMNATADDRANVDLTQTFVEGSFYVHPKPWLELGGTAAYENFDERLSSVEPRIVDVYTPATAPRLGAQPSYLHGKLSGAILWLQSPGYSRRGGLYRFTYHGYQELTPRSGRFGLYRGELVQHIPFLRENWVLSWRGRMESIVDQTTQVPFFLLPYPGSEAQHALSSSKGADTSLEACVVGLRSLTVDGTGARVPDRLGAGTTETGLLRSPTGDGDSRFMTGDRCPLSDR